MKKAVILSLLLIFLFAGFPAVAETNDNGPAPLAVFRIGMAKHIVNDLVKEDVAPFIENDRTYLPLRYVAYALGIGDNSIRWDSDTQTAYLYRAGQILAIRPGENNIVLNDVEIPVDSPALNREGRVMLPLRAVTAAFGSRVEWDEKEKKVVVYEK